MPSTRNFETHAIVALNTSDTALDTPTTAALPSRSLAPTSRLLLVTRDQLLGIISTADINLRCSKLVEQPHLKMMLRLSCPWLDLQRMVKL